jgi:hypothetical protein
MVSSERYSLSPWPIMPGDFSEGKILSLFIIRCPPHNLLHTFESDGCFLEQIETNDTKQLSGRIFA